MKDRKGLPGIFKVYGNQRYFDLKQDSTYYNSFQNLVIKPCRKL